jgi:hypothetical protein
MAEREARSPAVPGQGPRSSGVVRLLIVGLSILLVSCGGGPQPGGNDDDHRGAGDALLAVHASGSEPLGGPEEEGTAGVPEPNPAMEVEAAGDTQPAAQSEVDAGMEPGGSDAGWLGGMLVVYLMFLVTGLAAFERQRGRSRRA